MPTAETLRAREVYKYYQPNNASDTFVSDSSSSIDDQLLSPASRPARDTNFTTQQSFSDTALTAFAQLIALRLNSQRAIVSLIDHENEYFLAESTSTFSHVHDEGARNAWLSISGARIPRFASLCEETLHQAEFQAKGKSSVVLVPDLQLDNSLSRLDCVTGPPYLRFYCGVPLTNKNGITIGCVYVVDDRPRSGVSEPQAQYLHIMSETIMDHLENIRAKEDITRVTQMSQALHAFIEGDGTMDGDWQRLRKYSMKAGAAVGFRWESNMMEPKDVQESSSLSIPLSAGIEMGLKQSQYPLPAAQIELCQQKVQSPLQYSESPNTDSSQEPLYTNSSFCSSSSESPQLQMPIEPVHTTIDDILKSASTGKGTTKFVDTFSNQLHMTFSRASNLIREGMEVDGSVFFDAPEQFYQDRSKLKSSLQRPRLRGSISSSGSDEESDKDRRNIRPGPKPHQRSRNGSPSGSFSTLNTPKIEDDRINSDVLGFSTSDASSLNEQTMENVTTFRAITQRLMASLVRRWPKGKLFSFDEDGPIPRTKRNLTNDSSRTVNPSTKGLAKRARHKARKQADILSLLAAFPGARQIFFVPLLDSVSGCFIGSFAWSTSATRIFSTENHLSYLVAFGHSVMGEVVTLNTLSADRAKGDFISNVSHELRSPLHGILAGVEFLADTALDGFQRNLVETVDICGRTLLDTVEHILDFTKIKKFGQQSMQPIGVVDNFDISAVIEEVLEGVYAGFEFNGLASEGLADTTLSGAQTAKKKARSNSDEARPIFSNDQVTVILDIDFRENWRFPSVPGTWRRLTMNLFGNSLKYTKTGWIKIKLQAESMPHGSSSGTNNGIGRTLVTLTVSDSGQGMTNDFVERKLFMPFAQEDVTRPGTGLGMSIVKQLVDLSDGKINVQSSLGVGTEIKLCLPLDNCLRNPEDGKLVPVGEGFPENAVTALRRRAKGRAVSIRGFEGLPGDSVLQHEALASLKKCVINYITQWFGLDILPSNSKDAASLVVTDEIDFFNESKPKGDVPDQVGCLLVVCGKGVRHNIYGSPLDKDHVVEFVGRPCGPHRLAKALLRCLDIVEAGRQQASMQETGTCMVNEIHTEQAFSPILPVKVEHLEPISNVEGCDLAIDKFTIPPPETNMSEAISSGHSMDSKILSGSSETILPSPSFRSYANGLENSPSHQPKMLLVEDNPVNMMLLATYMTKKKWDFEKACNGLEALEAFQNRPQGFDVVFMDVSMPIMTGYESTRAIRALEYQRFNHPSLKSLISAAPESAIEGVSEDLEAQSQPEGERQVIDVKNKSALIIALTGFSSREDQEMASASGMDVFMTKPVRFKEVGIILEEFMKDGKV